jgi:phosphomannomutase/phosphoglucomutase
VTEENKFEIVDNAVKHFSALYDVIAVDGARVLFENGWGLVRASNTQPVLVLRYEARTAAALSEIQSVMEDWMRSQGVDLTATASH